jgi:tetratricopeptide (TPR) repeat protein
MKPHSRRIRLVGAGALTGQLLLALPAFGAPSASEKAAAEALFNDGTALMQAQNYADACAKFEASNAIEPGLGVKLWLADCYDRAGRTASAWALFSEAAALAQKSGQDERAKAAAERSADLEKRLSKLEIVPPARALPDGYSVTLDGKAIPSASVGSALPVDPGTHVVVVEAPGYRSLTVREEVPAGPTSVKLPLTALEPAPVAPAPSAGAATAAGRKEGGPTPGHTHRVLAYSLGGLGVLSLAGSGLLAYRAHQLDKQSLDHCLVNEPNACNEHGASLRGQAQNYGNAATAAVIAGGALVATGVVLLLTAPSGKKSEIRVGGSVTPGGGTLFVGGTL